MIDPRTFLEALRANGVGLVTGVPDSLLRELCAAFSHLLPTGAHVIAANEGAAVGLAIGHHLATGAVPLVYMQNSGLGNAINPLASLADPAIYGVPMLLLIGWRAEMGPQGQIGDEPQHVVQGRVTIGQLDLLSVPHHLIGPATDVASLIADAVAQARGQSRPVALVVRKQAFAPYQAEAAADAATLTREAAISAVIGSIPDEVPVVATTGMASRELFELRKARGVGHGRDFLTVGGMGHAASIATGIALASPGKVLCLDGDGAMLMHLGALTESAARPNLVHVVLNNGAHDSVGGQPTAAARLDLTALARSCGYREVSRASTAEEIEASIAKAMRAPESAFVEIRCRKGARPDLGRPDRSPQQNKTDFMAFMTGPT